MFKDPSDALPTGRPENTRVRNHGKRDEQTRRRSIGDYCRVDFERPESTVLASIANRTGNDFGAGSSCRNVLDIWYSDVYIFARRRFLCRYPWLGRAVHADCLASIDRHHGGVAGNIVSRWDENSALCHRPSSLGLTDDHLPVHRLDHHHRGDIKVVRLRCANSGAGPITRPKPRRTDPHRADSPHHLDSCLLPLDTPPTKRDLQRGQHPANLPHHPD